MQEKISPAAQFFCPGVSARRRERRSARRERRLPRAHARARKADEMGIRCVASGAVDSARKQSYTALTAVTSA